MKIGVIIGRIGGVDGVALETMKWIEVLKRMGHEVFVMSGEFENWEGIKFKHYRYPVLSFFSPDAEWGQKRAFFQPDDSPEPLLEHVKKISNIICNKLEKWIVSKNIDCLLSENASALPSHLSMGIGIKKLVEKTGINTVTHDHDFHWERGKRYKSIHPEINQLVDDSFPLLIPHVRHAVINTFAVETLKKRFNIDAVNVPNVMDFTKPYGIPDENNNFFFRKMGVRKNDIALLQVTRIVRRKGIETAISLLDKLQDKKIKLVITGNYKDDENRTYYNELVELVHDLNLTSQIIPMAHDVLNHDHLSDVYAHGTACTYFSTYEGFGNAFIESVLAKKPIFVNNYKPVYMPDIGSKGFKTVMLEDSQLTDDKVKDMAEIIYNPDLAKEIGEYNFELGKKHFSYDVLEEKLTQLFSF